MKHTGGVRRHMGVAFRPVVVGWGLSDDDFSTSYFARGGSSATARQQDLDVPVISAEEVTPVGWSDD